MNLLERFFKIRENNTTLRREIYTGTITFIAISYILAVNPEILSNTGMARGGLFYVTAFAAFTGCEEFQAPVRRPPLLNLPPASVPEPEPVYRH